MSHASSDPFANDADLSLSIPLDSTAESVLQPIVDHLDLPIIRVNRTWQITFINAAAAEWFERDTADILGAEFWSLWLGVPNSDFMDTLHRMVVDETAATCELDVFAHDKRLCVRVQ